MKANNFSFFCLTIAFTFLISTKEEMSQALSPKSAANQISSLVTSFEIALDHILLDPEFKRTFGIEEKIEFVESTAAGDLHVYFEIDKIDFDPLTGMATLEIFSLMKSPDGLVRRVPKKLELDVKQVGYSPPYERDQQAIFRELCLKLRRLLSDVDLGLKSRIWNKEVFRNQTRLVVFRGKESKKLYKFYYKFGKSSIWEVLGTELLRRLEMNSAWVYPDYPNDCVWLRAVESETYAQTFLKDSLSVNHWDQIEMTKEKKELFTELGQSIAITFILGHDDFHQGNFLITSEWKGFTVVRISKFRS